ncbi:MAG: hypothetical protein QOI79_4424, partial [Mycobacterium sp.]|nr:hypothetical protein [Mycobacterium sp.]
MADQAGRRKVTSVPAALRPTAGAGISLSTLAAQVGAIPAAGSTASDP